MAVALAKLESDRERKVRLNKLKRKYMDDIRKSSKKAASEGKGKGRGRGRGRAKAKEEPKAHGKSKAKAKAKASLSDKKSDSGQSDQEDDQFSETSEPAEPDKGASPADQSHLMDWEHELVDKHQDKVTRHVSVMSKRQGPASRYLVGIGEIVVNRAGNSLTAHCFSCGMEFNKSYRRFQAAARPETRARGRPLAGLCCLLELRKGCPGNQTRHRQQWDNAVLTYKWRRTRRQEIYSAHMYTDATCEERSVNDSESEDEPHVIAVD